MLLVGKIMRFFTNAAKTDEQLLRQAGITPATIARLSVVGTLSTLVSKENNSQKAKQASGENNIANPNNEPKRGL